MQSAMGGKNTAHLVPLECDVSATSSLCTIWMLEIQQKIRSGIDSLH